MNDETPLTWTDAELNDLARLFADTGLIDLIASYRAQQRSIADLQRVGDDLFRAARHSDSCGLRYQSHCTCVIAAWERLRGRRA
jgi:hypothetical protein